MNVLKAFLPRCPARPMAALSALLIGAASLLVTGCVTMSPEDDDYREAYVSEEELTEIMHAVDNAADRAPFSDSEIRRFDEDELDIDAPGEITPAVKLALGQVGTRYRFGGMSPDSGFDCSGLMNWAYAKQGLRLPRTALEMSRTGQSVPVSKARPGDLIIFKPYARRSGLHVGMVTEKGLFVHAPRTGRTVAVEKYDRGYWQQRIVSIRRLETASSKSKNLLVAAAPAGALMALNDYDGRLARRHADRQPAAGAQRGRASARPSPRPAARPAAKPAAKKAAAS
ncbi:MAG: C40 family peptidase, partial [Duodenibacillus sp.]|nr:C40 family peptidase [Duodenibacillus sp.]